MTALLQESPGLPGVSRSDAATFILQGLKNTLRGGHTPGLQSNRVFPDLTHPAAYKLQCL